MRRREFFTVLGGAAAGWPLAARSQQPQRRIGVLMNAAADDPEGQARIAAFHQGLQELGWTLGRNARIDARWGAVDADSSRRYAADWSGSRPMSFSPQQAPRLQRFNRRPVRYRSYLRRSPTLLAPGSSRPWHIRAATSLDLAHSSTPSAENGLSCACCEFHWQNKKLRGLRVLL